MKLWRLGLGFSILLFVGCVAYAGPARDFSGAYNHPIVPVVMLEDPEPPAMPQVIARDMWIPSNYRLIFGDQTPTDVYIQKSSANTITVTGNLTCTGATCGGGITSVTSLPGTCTPGNVITLTPVNGTSLGAFYCGGIGAAANVLQPDDKTQAVSPLSYGARWDVKYITDAAWGSGVTTVTCPNSNCGFTTNQDNAKIEFGTSAPVAVNGTCSGVSCGQLLIPQGTLTVVSANQATVSIASTGSCAIAGGLMCPFAWGTQDDTPAINLAAQAAWNNGNTCKELKLPSGSAFFSGQILHVLATAPGNPCGNSSGTPAGTQADAIQVGAVVDGQGPSVTTLIPLPTFTFANPVIGGTPQAQYHDFGVNGLGQSLSGTSNAVSLFQAIGGSGCSGSTAFNLGLSNWATQSTGTIGFDFGGGACGDPATWNIISEMFGETSCKLSASGNQPLLAQAIACFGSNSGNGSLLVSNAGILTTIGSYFQGVMTTGAFSPAVQVNGSGVWNDYGSHIGTQFSLTGQAIALYINASGPIAVHLNGSVVDMSAGNTNSSSTLLFLASSGNITLTAQNTQFAAAGANNRTIQMGATDSFVDEGGNSWTLGSQANSITGGSFVADGHSVKAICTGVANASVTNSLYGTGPNVTATTCAGQTATLGAGLPVSGPRTLMGLLCTSSATTVSVACTLMVNGVASALTCTMTAATSCNDFVHSVALNDGDLVSERIVTGAAETGANIKSIAWWN